MNNTINFEKKKVACNRHYIWYVLLDMLPDIEKLLFTTETERDVVMFLVRKTLQYSKLKDKISTDWLQHYSTTARPTLYAAKSKLIKRGVIIELPGKYYCLNILGIAKLYTEIYGYHYKESILEEFKLLTKNIMEQNDIFHIGDIEVNEEKRMNLEDSLAKTEKKIEGKKEARKKKLREKSRLRIAQQIPPFARMICEENAVDYGGKDWTLKEWGQARNWLKACEREGDDPKKILTEVCSKWNVLCGVVMGRDGRPLLDTVFSFPNYYKYRDKVTKALIQGLGESKYGSFKIIDLKKGEEMNESHLSMGGR